MRTDCKNCATAFEGAYCSNCGQPADTHAINSHYLWHDIQHGLLHFDKGLLYTAKELFTRPGHSIRGFIEGKRVQHFKPISFVVLLAGLYGYLYHAFHIDLLGDSVAHGKTTLDMRGVNDWIATHYALSELLFIPFTAVASFLAFHGKGYNFIEHFVLNTFLAGQRLLLRLAFFPFMLLFPQHQLLTGSVPDVVSFGLTAWTFIQFFQALPPAQRFWRTVLYFVLYFTILIVVTLAVGIVVGLYTVMTKHVVH